jgi:hypothetical protein
MMGTEFCTPPTSRGTWSPLLSSWWASNMLGVQIYFLLEYFVETGGVQ